MPSVSVLSHPKKILHFFVLQCGSKKFTKIRAQVYLLLDHSRSFLTFDFFDVCLSVFVSWDLSITWFEDTARVPSVSRPSYIRLFCFLFSRPFWGHLLSLVNLRGFKVLPAWFVKLVVPMNRRRLFLAVVLFSFSQRELVEGD